MNQKKSILNKKIILIAVMALMLVLGICACRSGHAPGYGNTGKCTICGKTAAHKTSNYGFCTKHWKEATK